MPLDVSFEHHAAPNAAIQAFPINGTLVADFQPGDVTGAGLRLQTPGDDLGLLLVVAFEDWQTGAHVAHVFLKAKTIETLHLPPDRYRIVIAEGRAWYGLAQLFGPDTRVAETIGYMAPSVAKRASDRLIFGSDTRYPTTEVPTGFLKCSFLTDADRGSGRLC